MIGGVGQAITNWIWGDDKPAARPARTGGQGASGDTNGVSRQGRLRAAGAGMADAMGANPQGTAIARSARSMVGKTFKPGEEARCADFTSTVVEQAAGPTPKGFFHTVTARDFGKMGAQPVSRQQLRPGDIVAFNNTWRESKDSADHTHVGVYVGNGQFVHRPTNEKDYLPGSKPGEVVQESLDQYLARDRGDRNATLVGGYRMVG